MIDTFETLHKLWLEALIARTSGNDAAKTKGDQESAPVRAEHDDQDTTTAGEENKNQEDTPAPQQEQKQEILDPDSYGEQANTVAYAIAEALCESHVNGT